MCLPREGGGHPYFWNSPKNVFLSKDKRRRSYLLTLVCHAASLVASPQPVDGLTQHDAGTLALSGHAGM